jgi:hypothetical protein
MDFFTGYSGKDVKLTAHIHPVQQLRMPGYLPPPPMTMYRDKCTCTITVLE